MTLFQDLLQDCLGFYEKSPTYWVGFYENNTVYCLGFYENISNFALKSTNTEKK
jgi:hypothetical protein